ncbi:hypothetical protein FRB97_001300 [Tulasnella sp. 331]|nr:hypothetical protein FRB97_001300 [Tulasnella sp. 331]
MAAELTELSAQLEQSVGRSDVDGIDVKLELSVLRPDAVGRHQKLSMRWKDIVNQIRGLSGFTTFFQPSPFHLLAHAADEGHFIIINVSSIRSDGIILRKGVEPDVVKLPDATPQVVKLMSSLMETALGVPGSGECEKGIKLYAQASSPLEYLNQTEMVAQTLYWNVLTRSYTGLLKDLAASHDAAVERLPTRRWIHIACHRHRGIARPFQWRFRLQDKPLTLQEVIHTNLPNTELAFLSACHTATGDRNTPDEGLHLAAAMQFAGFRGVVGTLWTMDDADGPDVVDSFYKFLFRKKKDGKTGDYKEAAKCVSRFTKMLRGPEDVREVPLE